MEPKKPHICFVAAAAWPVFSGDRLIQSVGGAEVQISFLARSLAESGYQVSMICMDYGQADSLVIDGVLMHKAHTPQAGIPIFRFIHPRFTSFWIAMKHANADIYYQRSGGVHTGFVAAFCKLFGRKFIFAGAHDGDFSPSAPLIRYQRDKAIFRWGLRHAHAVVVQSPTQADLCRETYGIKATLIKSCYKPPLGASVKPNGYVLWVATLRNWKQPELFIELARRLPQHRFRMVGGADIQFNFGKLRELAESLPNMEFVGFVPHAEIEAHFNGARLFVNTSTHEGFPNTFLQAWSRGMPTVSFVDTGSIHHDRSVANPVTNFDEMVTKVNRLMTVDIDWKEAGSLCMACYLAQHSLTSVVDEYAALFQLLFTQQSACRVLNG